MTDYSVIGKMRNLENIRRLIAGIEAKGKTCYDFTALPADPDNADAPGEVQMKKLESTPDFLSDPLYRMHFETDLAGLKNADAVILLLPAGTSAHIEAGIAFGLGKRLILIGEPEKPETLYHIFGERYASIEDFLAQLA